MPSGSLKKLRISYKLMEHSCAKLLVKTVSSLENLTLKVNRVASYEHIHR